jgi:hypothetical protein
MYSDSKWGDAVRRGGWGGGAQVVGEAQISGQRSKIPASKFEVKRHDL